MDNMFLIQPVQRLSKPLHCKDSEDHFVLDGVKCFREIKLEKYDRPFGSFALVNIFKAPCQAVLNGSATKKIVLVVMNTS